MNDINLKTVEYARERLRGSPLRFGFDGVSLNNQKTKESSDAPNQHESD
jgi:hypothetical protein